MNCVSIAESIHCSTSALAMDANGGLAMAEYIERERLLRRFNIDDIMNVNGTLISLEDARNTISNFPAADVAPVVRCENCTSGIMSDDNKYIICCRLGVGMELDDFCSYGAWKNNGGCSEWRSKK